MSSVQLTSKNNENDVSSVKLTSKNNEDNVPVYS